MIVEDVLIAKTCRIPLALKEQFQQLKCNSFLQRNFQVDQELAERLIHEEMLMFLRLGAPHN